MNTEILLAVFLGLVAYRVVSPVIDRLNPLNQGARKATGSASDCAVGRSSYKEIGREPDPRGGEKIFFEKIG